MKNHLNQVKITESQFADDVVVCAVSCVTFEKATEQFVNTASRWGLTVNINKTKGMVVGNQVSSIDTLPVQLDEGKLEMVQDFTYLSSNIIRDGEVKAEIKLHISKAARVLQKVYRAEVLSVLLYGAETWTIKAEEMRLLTSFHNRCVRTIMRVTRYQQLK